MRMDPLALTAFVVSAGALLGSPGPGIAALLVVGRTKGLAQGLRYYAGLQVGLALAAGVSAAGLLSVLTAIPVVMTAARYISTVYLVYLAYKIATSAVGPVAEGEQTSFSPAAGMVLGITNPKAYVAFASLFASRAVAVSSPQADLVVKWVLCVAVILVVDIVWLLVGVGLGRATLRPAAERWLNRCLAVMILGAAGLAFL